MVTHSGEPMNGVRFSVFAALLCMVPVLVWLVGQLRVEALRVSSVDQISRDAWQALGLCQACAAMLIAPVLEPLPAGEELAAALLFWLIPLPLSAILWMMGATTLHGMLLAIGSGWLFSAGLGWLHHALGRIMGRLAAETGTALTLTGVFLLWRFREDWLIRIVS